MRLTNKNTHWLPVVMGVMLITFAACNPTRERWINKKWHTLTGHYNVYFNGQIKFDEAVESYEKGIQNDFNRVLPVFLIPDETAAKGMTSVMDEVIKKTSKSIQNHTVGSYTDDSYLLMGKAQFYKGDYFAALETFQFINSKYPNSNLKKECTAWIALCYDALKKTGEAEAVMGLLINEIDPMKFMGKKKLPEKYTPKKDRLTKTQRAFIYATAAHIFLKQEKYNLATERLKVALQYTKPKPSRIRFNYILGQLNLMQDSIALAKKNFTLVTRLLAPYDFEFNANLNLTQLYDPKNKSEVKKVKRSLKRMLNDDKNAGLYDQIYYELARIEERDKDLPNAIKHYQLSASKSEKNQTQKAKSFLALGDIYLAEPNYKLGQAYYDSAAKAIPQEDKNYKKVQDKRNILSELISNILTIETEDSLQRLAKLDKKELEKKVDEWILAEKKRVEEEAKNAKLKKELEEHAALNKPMGSAAPTIPDLAMGGDAKWYFYNTSVVNKGQQEFFSQKKWGRRENEDYWRISSKEKPKQQKQPNENDGTKVDSVATEKSVGNISTSKQDKEETLDEKSQKVSVSEEKSAWVKDIPYTTSEVERSNQKIIEAYRNLGDIYALKIEDYKEATTSYNMLLKRFPSNKFEVEVLYQLYKSYQALKIDKSADSTKEALIKKYPESNYALLLQNKPIQTSEVSVNKEVIQAYEQLYAMYINGNYTGVKEGKHSADKKYSGNAMQAKFDLLYALAVGKTDSLGAFKIELQDIITAYPKTDVAERAKDILEAINTMGSKPKLDSIEAAPKFVLEPDVPHYYVFASRVEKLDLNEVLQRIISFNEEYHQMDGLRANTLLASDGYQILYVREFPKLEKAVKYMDGLIVTTFYKAYLPPNTSYVHFAVPVETFKKLMKDKRIDAYNEFFTGQLPTLLKQIKP
ncbi:MAG: tetratricopeptide repeat protein [Bacteroidia bacterium]|nr:tetratricopeptide repeat protein [Bacteroidia bacterium]